MRLKGKLILLASLFFGITFAYLVWLIWQKLSEWLGNSNWTIIICGIIVVIGLLLGFLSTKQIVRKFR